MRPKRLPGWVVVVAATGLVWLAARVANSKEPLPTSPNPQPRLGINLAGPADWNTELPFVDVFRVSRPWVSQKKGAAYGKGPELDLDEWGWVKRLQPSCFAESPLCTISGGHYPGGVYTVLYEGGQHMVAFVKDRELVARITRTMQEANRHPRMGDMYRRYFDHWAQIGGDTFAVFSSIGRWSNHGAWGVAEFYDSRPSEYPKYEAVIEWARKHGQAEGQSQ